MCSRHTERPDNAEGVFTRQTEKGGSEVYPVVCHTMVTATVAGIMDITTSTAVNLVATKATKAATKRKSP